MVCILYFIALSSYDRDTFIYVSGHTPLEKNIWKQMSVNILRDTSAILGSVFILLTIYRIYSYCRFDSRKSTNLLMQVGRNTMGIYIISSYMNIIILKLTKSQHWGVIVLIIETAITILISMLFILMIKRYRVPSQCLLGIGDKDKIINP